jgi:hypothetical protein
MQDSVPALLVVGVVVDLAAVAVERTVRPCFFM